MSLVPPMNLVWCRACRVGYPTSPLLAEDDQETKKREFCEKNHSAILLRGLKGSFRSNKPTTEPIRKGYFDAIDRHGDIWRVKKWRSRIDEPFYYRAWPK